MKSKNCQTIVSWGMSKQSSRTDRVDLLEKSEQW